MPRLTPEREEEIRGDLEYAEAHFLDVPAHDCRALLSEIEELRKEAPKLYGGYLEYRGEKWGSQEALAHMVKLNEELRKERENYHCPNCPCEE